MAYLVTACIVIGLLSYGLNSDGQASNLQFIASGTFTLDSVVSARLYRQWVPLALLEPGYSDLEAVYGHILSGCFTMSFDEAVRALVPKILKASIDVFFETKTALSPSTKDLSLMFNMRDLSRALIGI